MPKGKNSAWELMLKAHHSKLKRKNLHALWTPRVTLVILDRLSIDPTSPSTLDL